MNTQRVITITLALLFGGGAFFLLLRGQDSKSESMNLQTKRIRIAQVKHRDLQRNLLFSGTLRAADRANLTFTLSGRMAQRLVDMGDRVKKGQVIAQLDRAPLKLARDAAAANLRQVKARFQQAKRDVERVESLAAVKAATPEELEQVRAGQQVLEAHISSAATALQERERQLREAVLKAPFAGTITEVYLEGGEFASSGMPVVQLSGSGELELEVEVPEKVLTQCELGQTVEVTLPFSENRSLVGKVRSIAPSSGSPGRLFPMVISLNSAKGLYAGMTAKLRLTLPQPDSLLVPVSAVINPGGSQPMVFRVQDRRVEEVEVEIGELIGEWVTVDGALNASDFVAISGFYGLLSGDAVEVAQ